MKRSDDPTSEKIKLLDPSTHGSYSSVAKHPSVPKKSLYKGSHHMSISAFQTMTDEIVRQQSVRRTLGRSESTPALQATAIEAQGRSALYGSLPFVATFGMQHRENKIRRVLSTVSTNTLESLALQESTHTKMLSKVDVDEYILTFPLVMAVLVAIIAEFLVGYNTGVMNAPANVVFPGHTTAQWSLAVSAFAIGGPGGAVLGGIVANRNGRRGAMMINTWIFFIGGVLMTLAPNIYWLIPARLIVGFASGLATVVVPVYLGEIAPPTLRGTLGTCTQFAMVIGIFMSDVAAFPLATENGWRFLFAVTPVLCLIQVLVSPFLLESPRWLLNINRDSVEARIVIKQMRGFRSDAEVEWEVEHFMFAASKHKTDRKSAHSSDAMWDLLFRARDQRVLVISSVILQMAQQLCGINAVFYYSTTFFEGIISNPLMGSTLVGFVNVIATYVALKLMDSTARRTLILWSSFGMLVSTVLIIAALLGVIYNSIALVAVMAFVSFFEIGLGPIPWLIVAEMFDAKYVATAMSIACIVNWACNFLVGLLFPFIQEALGPWSFAPFGVVLVMTFLFTYFYLPETHGRTVEEIQRLVGSPDEDVRNAIEIIQAVEDFEL